MSDFYESTLLREEYKLVTTLQKHNDFKKYVEIFYVDRITGEKTPVLTSPNGNRYPEHYIVNYRLPVYTRRGQLRQDFHAEANITLSKAVLSQRNASNAPHVTFNASFAPYNNHVTKSSICSGNAWVVAKENGLWHFIISIGALINQDEYVSAEGSHFNGDAYEYWKQRGRKPVTNIDWPLDLLEPKLKIKKIDKRTENTNKPKISVVSKSNSNTPSPKEIKIIAKPTLSSPNIKIIKKN